MCVCVCVCVCVDGALVPEPVQKVFDRVRNNADFMPSWQMEVYMNVDPLPYKVQGRHPSTLFFRLYM